MYYMRNTLTIRTDSALREALDRRAEEQDKTVSEVVRELLWHALEERPLGHRTAHVRGGLKLTKRPEKWRQRLRERNWRD